MSNSKSSLWESKIPKTNNTTIVTALICLLLSYSIGRGSPVLMDFVYMMFVVFGVYILFFLIEARLAKLYKDDATHPADESMKKLIIYRNFVVILNVIPFIQLIGLLFIPTFIIWLPWYLIKLSERSK
jgi:hypothetical protein